MRRIVLACAVAVGAIGWTPPMVHALTCPPVNPEATHVFVAQVLRVRRGVASVRVVQRLQGELADRESVTLTSIVLSGQTPPGRGAQWIFGAVRQSDGTLVLAPCIGWGERLDSRAGRAMLLRYSRSNTSQ